jgi:hypothetical protein
MQDRQRTSPTSAGPRAAGAAQARDAARQRQHDCGDERGSLPRVSAAGSAMVRGGYRCEGRRRGDSRMAVDVRTLPGARAAAAWAVLSRAFGHTPAPDDVDVELALVDPRRAYAPRSTGAGRDGGVLRLPHGRPGPGHARGRRDVGRRLPTYRRRGLLGALMSAPAHRPARVGTRRRCALGLVEGRSTALGLRRRSVEPRGDGGAAGGPPSGCRCHPATSTWSTRAAELLAATLRRVAARTPGFASRDDR